MSVFFMLIISVVLLVELLVRWLLNGFVSCRWERQSLLSRMQLVVELFLLIKRMKDIFGVIISIHILGSYANIAVARNAICNLIMGSPPNKVYNQMKQVAARQRERF